MAVVHTPGVGAPPSGIAKIAGSVGKPSSQQLTSVRPGPGSTTGITGGSALPQMMGHYGKTPPAALSSNGMPGTTGIDPTQHPGAAMIRGGKGGMKRNPRSGGLGPGPQATAGGDTNYNATSQDTE